MKNQETHTYKLILGTAQLGLNYGINNAKGKPSKAEAFDILSYAYDIGIQLLDTAEVYGDAVELIGEFHKTYSTKKFEIISKFKIPKDQLLTNITIHLKENLNRLNIDHLWAYLFHSFDDYEKHHHLIAQLNRQKEQGKIRYLGVSIYTNEQFEQVINDEHIDLIQLPFNLLDNFNLRGDLIQKARQKNKIIHTRSVFLQGLFFKNPEVFPTNLIPLSTPVKQLQQISSGNKISMASLCLNYPIQNQHIDGVLLGVDNIKQLVQNVKELRDTINPAIYQETENLVIDHPQLLNPSLW